MSRQRINFIEWMKALGMFVIIYGHTNGHAIFNPTLPVNLKQIGVVFFVFSTGYLLAGETRAWLRVFFNRLFELFLFGILFSVLMSIVRYYQFGNLAESNYLPFMFGLNVVFNAFPANPSLWYIGTYIHLLAIWALFLRHLKIRPWMIVAVIPVEIGIRIALMRYAGDFIAYQALTNWASVLLLGMYLGQQSAGDRLDDSKLSLAAYTGGLVIAVSAWMWVANQIGVTVSNPFGRLQSGGEYTMLVSTAASVSLIYIMWAILGFQVFRRLQAGPTVQFFGRNSMICFIIHMPLIFAISPWLYELPGIESSPYVRLAANLLIFYVGACLLSEWMRKVLKPAELRKAIEHKFGLFKNS